VRLLLVQLQLESIKRTLAANQLAITTTGKDVIRFRSYVQSLKIGVTIIQATEDVIAINVSRF
jgi:hypothetical protein